MPIRRQKDSLELAILAGMTKTREINQHGRLYASSSGLCARQTTLQANFVGTEIQAPETTAYFKTGIAVEEIVLDALYAKNQLVFRDFKLPEVGLNIGGKIDGFSRINDEPIYGLEIKSCGSTIPSSPKKEHLAQAILYSAISGFPFKVVYFSRSVADKDNNILLRSFNLDFNWLDRYQTLYQAVLGYYGSKYQVMPKISQFIEKPLDCGFCRFKAICWENQASFLPGIETLDLKEQSAIYDLAEQTTTELMQIENVEQRRNGILKHMSIAGNEYARKLLKGDWNLLLTNG